MSLEELRVRWQRALLDRGPCIRCQGVRIRFGGTRTRKATLMIEGAPVFVPDIPERRLKCRSCRLQWTHAPEGISARAHYQPCVVGQALAMMEQEPDTTVAEIASAHGCHPRTLGRWVDRVADIAEPQELAAALVAIADAPVLPALSAEIERPGGGHAHKRLLRALTVLALLEALASLHGLEPPALGHARELTVQERPLTGPGPANAPGPRSRGDPGSHV
jgi:transposase-like protein